MYYSIHNVCTHFCVHVSYTAVTVSFIEPKAPVVTRHLLAGFDIINTDDWLSNVGVTSVPGFSCTCLYVFIYIHIYICIHLHVLLFLHMYQERKMSCTVMVILSTLWAFLKSVDTWKYPISNLQRCCWHSWDTRGQLVRKYQKYNQPWLFWNCEEWKRNEAHRTSNISTMISAK